MTPAPGAGESIEIRTPAKINLGLRIVGRRDDGYHLLESVFVPVDLYDRIRLEWGPGERVTELQLEIAEASGLPKALAEVTDGPDNLVVRAAEAFRAAVPRPGRLRIALEKRIPSGAGLGGGSSDAGAVLSALAALAGPEAPPDGVLEEIALGLGADVPYFLRPRPAFVTGIGEEIEPIEALPTLPLVLANPGISVATAEVYRVAATLRRSLTDPGAGSTMRAISDLCGEIEAWVPALGEILVNDLEPAAIRLCPPVGRLLAALRATGALGVGMSGSGGTVFGVYPSMDDARRAADRLRSKTETGGRVGWRAGLELRSGSVPALEVDVPWIHVCNTLDPTGPGTRWPE